MHYVNGVRRLQFKNISYSSAMLPIPVFVVSLPSDIDRRNILVKRFRLHSSRFLIVDAIDLRQEDAREVGGIRPCYLGAPLTVTEMGCALSHCKVLNIFLSGSDERCLVLEDDVEGDDVSLESALTLLSELPADAILICGGQEGLRNGRYLFGRRVGARVWRIPSIARRFMARACCYGLTKEVSALILQRQLGDLKVADSWYRLLAGHKNVYFSPVLRHPVDLSGSHLEAQRIEVNRGMLGPLLRDGICYTVATTLIKVFLPVLLLVSGYELVREKG